MNRHHADGIRQRQVQYRARCSHKRDVFMEAMAAGWSEKNPVDLTKPVRVTIHRERLTLD